ncbi:MAG: hypothetical protein A3F42_02230 [Gammaproteobacteria bacterium RIFCSPHIGHO2_12_FULL_37_34]|nr:MAG: hypothetical protein A3F42_02230 [Gammaproteobacteria bacterium RIFCSPHIGHO2_12_FULL_37_34]
MLNYVEMLKLESHEEGGYFGLYYQSPNKVMPLSSRYKNDATEQRIERHAGSSIYFLLEKQGFSAWHRLKSDEIWHYYAGSSPIDIYIIDDNGRLKIYTLGHPNIIENALFQVVVKAGVWFAAKVRDELSFGLVGCTVSPGFEYHDFELAEKYRDQLVKQYPELTSIIDRFIKPNVIQSNNNHTYDHHVAPHKNQLSAKDYVRKLKLERYQEGGYFCLNYKAKDSVFSLDPHYKNNAATASSQKTKWDVSTQERSAGTSIYFLLDKQDFSAWHRLKSDEIWHYYDGSPIDIHIIDQYGNLNTHILGNPSMTKGASFQVVIQANDWVAAEVKDKLSFGLIGRTTSPGLKYGDFELADRKILLFQFPQHENIINRFTRITPTHSKSWPSKTTMIGYATVALVASLGLYSLFKENVISDIYVDDLKSRLQM